MLGAGWRSGRPLLGRASETGAADPREPARANELLDLAPTDLAPRSRGISEGKAPDVHAALLSEDPCQRFAPHIGQRSGDLLAAIPYPQLAQT